MAVERVAALDAAIRAAGAVGHLDSKTGFGPWPQGERLVDALVAGRPLDPYGF